MHYLKLALTRRFIGIVTIVMTGMFWATPIVQAQWTPPIGIPVPPFGITQVAPPLPNPWTSNVSGFYYVREGGTNTGNGYPTNPRNDIPRTLPAGTVVVLAGTYTRDHENAYFQWSGTASQPVWLIGSAADPAIITRYWTISGSYFIVEHIKAKWTNAGGTGKIALVGDHGVLRHTDLRGDTGNGIGGVFPNGSYHVIWDNYIHDAGNVSANFDQDVHCIVVSESTDHLWIVDNELARCSGDGVQLNAGNQARQPTLNHIYIGRNVAHHNKQSGFWTKQAVDVIFSQNTSYGHRPSGSSSGACMGGQYGPSFAWFIYNHIYDCEAGIRIESTSDLGSGTDVFVIGNVIHDITDSVTPEPDNPHASGAIVFRSLQNRHVVNNTLWNYQAGIMSPTSFGTINIKNNILGGRNSSLGRDIYLEFESLANASLLNNSFFGPSSVRIQWGSGTVYTSLAAFSAATGKGQASLQVDPQFVDVASKNFQLRVVSPAINASTADTVYTTFLNRYGIDIRKDFVGTPRPQGASFDIGAYEYTSQVALQPPNPPTQLQVR